MIKLKVEELVEMRRAAIGTPCPLCAELMLDMALCVVDHDHTSGEVRGVLCRWCNAQLGKAENAAKRAKRSLSVTEWLHNATRWTETGTGLMYPTHKSVAEKKEAAAKKRKTAAAKRAAQLMKAKQ